MSTDKARHREYPSCYRGDFRVFMMPGKSDFKLVAITASLHKSYPAVTDVFRVRTNRIRITVSDRMHANAIAADPQFTDHYRVYIPGGIVEVAGVEEDLDIPSE